MESKIGRQETEKENWLEKLRGFIREAGMARLLICVAAGVFLLFLSIPVEKKEQKQEEQKIASETTVENTELNAYIENLENKLKAVLSNVDGIGEVEVMITAKSSKEKVTLKDTPYSRKDTTETDSTGGTRENVEISSEESSVMEKAEDGSESPYITKEVQPESEGVVVIAQGADQKKVETEINEAVVALFDVPSHKIKVMKMK